MNNIEQLNNFLGRITEQHCPECQEYIIQDATGVQWCSGDECTWSNDESLQEFIEIWKDEDDRQVPDREEDNK